MTSAFLYDSYIEYNDDVPYDAFVPSLTPVNNPTLPHLSASLVLTPDGTFSYLVQDTLDEVAQSVEVVCGSDLGARTVVPQFGLPQMPFEGPNKNTIQTAIHTWEPRAVSSVSISTSDAGVANVAVAVALATGVGTV
jgi:phage baseplate assembly protein W